MTSTDSLSGDLLQVSGTCPTIACTDRVKGCHPNGVYGFADGADRGGSVRVRDHSSRDEQRDEGTAARDANVRCGPFPLVIRLVE